MRPKELQCIVTFHTTTEAMQLEQAAKTVGFGGRIIPVPREITAGCGLAWRDSIDARAALIDMMTEQKLSYDKIVELII
jgi:hypothetical protein